MPDMLFGFIAGVVATLGFGVIFIALLLPAPKGTHDGR